MISDCRFFGLSVLGLDFTRRRTKFGSMHSPNCIPQAGSFLSGCLFRNRVLEVCRPVAVVLDVRTRSETRKVICLLLGLLANWTALGEEGGTGHYVPGSVSSFVDATPPLKNSLDAT